MLEKGTNDYDETMKYAAWNSHISVYNRNMDIMIYFIVFNNLFFL